jgi:hypothetical protein
MIYLLLPIAFVLLFGVIWAGVCLLLSHMGGWARLAEHYAARDDEPGETHYMCSGAVGWVSYRSCLILRVCDNGLRMSVWFPFRIGHPPLFIPWDEFHGVFEKRMLRLTSFVVASVGMPVVAEVALPLWVREQLPVEVMLEED